MAEVFLNEGKASNGTQLLSARSVHEMMENWLS